jgi:hypothetical protein
MALRNLRHQPDSHPSTILGAFKLQPVRAFSCFLQIYCRIHDRVGRDFGLAHSVSSCSHHPAKHKYQRRHAIRAEALVFTSSFLRPANIDLLWIFG